MTEKQNVLLITVHCCILYCLYERWLFMPWNLLQLPSVWICIINIKTMSTIPCLIRSSILRIWIFRAIRHLGCKTRESKIRIHNYKGLKNILNYNEQVWIFWVENIPSQFKCLRTSSVEMNIPGLSSSLHLLWPLCWSTFYRVGSCVIQDNKCGYIMMQQWL